jgi:hypothetical protein
MSLFTKAITIIAIEDIEAFCAQGFGEGIRIEYKKDFSGKNANRQIAKEIASFANTYGGLLLVGVEEKDGKPVLPLCGIDYFPGIEEKVSSIAFANINPPVFPEIRICRFNDNPAKAVVLMRVQESDHTPHRIEQDTQVYVRVASQAEPVLAPFEQVIWLLNRREKAKANRATLLERANRRFVDRYSSEPIEGSNMSLMTPLPATRINTIIPLYPERQIIEYQNLGACVNRIVAETPCRFPIDIGPPVSVHESIIYSKRIAETDMRHAEINKYGLIFSRESYLEDRTEALRGKVALHLTLQTLCNRLVFASSFYRETGYWGLLRIHINFDGVKGKPVCWGPTGHDEAWSTIAFDNEISVEREMTHVALVERFQEIVEDVYREILWAFNLKERANNGRLIEEDVRGALNELNVNPGTGR